MISPKLDGPRGAKAGELAEVVRGANEVFVRGGDGDMERWYPLLFNRANAENLRVFRDGERIASQIGLCFRDLMIRGARIPAVAVGAVFTLASHRGLGSATRLMEDSFALCRRRGVPLMLVSGGRGLYRRLDCVTAGEFWKYRVERPPSLRYGATCPSVKIRRATEKDLATMVAIYRKEAVRFVRPLSDARKLWAAGMLMNNPSSFWMVERGGKAVAYCGHTRIWQGRAEAGKPPPKRVLPVMEIAGERRAIAEALPLLFAHNEAEELAVFGLGCDGELAAALKDFPREPTEFWGTIKILDAAKFWRCVRAGAPRELRVRAGGDWIEFGLGCERVRLEGAAAVTRAIFGARKGEELAGWPPPVTTALGAALRGMFPVPLVWYGWNYI